MFRYLRFRWKISRLERRRSAAWKETKKDVAAALARNASTEEVHKIVLDGGGPKWHDEIRAAQTSYLLEQADRLIVEQPGVFDEEAWDQGAGGERFLTEAAFGKLREAIRTEQKAWVERFLIWVPGIIGILGALTGLVSVLKGK